jgi:hypothetical protein
MVVSMQKEVLRYQIRVDALQSAYVMCRKQENGPWSRLIDKVDVHHVNKDLKAQLSTPIVPTSNRLDERLRNTGNAW